MRRRLAIGPILNVAGRTGLAAAAALLLASPPASAAATRPPTLTHDDNVFAFIVPGAKGASPFYTLRLYTTGFGLQTKLRIHCLSSCSLFYSEDVGLHLLGVMVLGSDVSAPVVNLATWWESGSTAWVIVYRVTPTGVRRVLAKEGTPVLIPWASERAGP